MTCDGGVGICRYDPCGQWACLNEAGYCSSACQYDDTDGNGTTRPSYRFGVQTPGLPTLWYDRPTFEEAAFPWSLIRDYGRDDVMAMVQRQDRDGPWTTVLGLRTTGPGTTL